MLVAFISVKKDEWYHAGNLTVNLRERQNIAHEKFLEIFLFRSRVYSYFFLYAYKNF